MKRRLSNAWVISKLFSSCPPNYKNLNIQWFFLFWAKRKLLIEGSIMQNKFDVQENKTKQVEEFWSDWKEQMKFKDELPF